MARSRRAGVDCPIVFFVDDRRIYMEYIEGNTIKQLLDVLHTSRHQHENYKMDTVAEEIETRFGVSPEKLIENLPAAIGRDLAQLHGTGIIHGDLTSSNIMLRPCDSDNRCSVVFIDFGLSANGKKPEDLAVDLYVMERAFAATHGYFGTSFIAEVIDFYLTSLDQSGAIFSKLTEVRKRGRKRLAIG